MTNQTPSDPANETANAASPPDVTVVSCMTDAAPYLLEWVAWHALIGATRFVIFSHACSDTTEAMLDQLAGIGPLEHHRLTLPAPDKQPIHVASRLAADLPAVKDADWAIVLRVDEFLDISVGTGRLEDLVAHVTEQDAPSIGAGATVDAISLPWRFIGSQRQADFDPSPVTSRFLRGARIDGKETEPTTGFRTLYRPAAFSRHGPSRPWGWKRGTKARGLWLNASGSDISEAMGQQAKGNLNALPESAFGAAHASVRRYAVKSRSEFLYGQLSEIPPGEGGKAPKGWEAWTLRDINAVSLPPLGPEPLGRAIEGLAQDPQLARLQSQARTDLQKSVEGLVAAQPAARHFLETGETWEANSASGDGPPTAPRLLCVATHPRAGTLWMRRALNEAAKALDVPVIKIGAPQDLAQIPPAGPAILVNWRSRFPRALFERRDARILHIVRDPRDMLISAMRFHRVVPAKDDKTVHTPMPEFSGMSYQLMLNALPDDATRLRFEMDHRHADVMDDMMSWAFGRMHSRELRYEELVQDHECSLFGEALAWAGVAGLDANTLISSYWNHALFGGLAERRGVDPRLQRHITSAQPERWRHELPRTIASEYAARYGHGLRVLGYAADDTWVSACADTPPAPEPTPR